MISADRLLPLWLKYRDALEAPIRTFEFEKFGRRFEDRTYQMGVLNLSPDSTYRETVCHTFEAALYRGRRMTLEGAAMVDIGAEFDRRDCGHRRGRAADRPHAPGRKGSCRRRHSCFR